MAQGLRDRIDKELRDNTSSGNSASSGGGGGGGGGEGGGGGGGGGGRDACCLSLPRRDPELLRQSPESVFLSLDELEPSGLSFRHLSC